MRSCGDAAMRAPAEGSLGGADAGSGRCGGDVCARGREGALGATFPAAVGLTSFARLWLAGRAAQRPILAADWRHRGFFPPHSACRAQLVRAAPRNGCGRGSSISSISTKTGCFCPRKRWACVIARATGRLHRWTARDRCGNHTEAFGAGGPSGWAGPLRARAERPPSAVFVPGSRSRPIRALRRDGARAEAPGPPRTAP